MTKKELIEEAVSAYIWEGMATKKIVENNEEINISVVGFSTVEHSGDEDGIMSQVSDLVGLKANEDKTEYIIKSSSCEISKEERISSDEYRVKAEGLVTIKINHYN